MMDYLTKFKKQTTLTTQILIVLGIVIVINFLSYQLFARFDLTQNNIYSLSDTSKQTVGNLDDVVTIKAYFSQSLPPQYAAVRQEVEDILSEYQTYGGGDFRVEFIDPKDDEQLAQELQLLGIPRLQFNILENDKYEVTSGYLGMAVQYGDNTQAIPVVSDTQNLEYQITSALKKVTTFTVPAVGFTTGFGEYARGADMSMLDKKLSEIYPLRDINLADGDAVPEDIATLIVAGPTEAMSERAQYALDQFVMRGGSIIFLAPGVTIDENLLAQPNETGLNSLLNDYGFNVENYFVLDVQNDRASFNQGFLTFTTEYPFFVRVTESGFARENAAVARLQNAVFPWTSPLSILNPEQVSILAQTTPQAWLMQENFNLSPQGDFGFTQDANAYTLAAARLGNVTSAFDAYVPKEAETGEHISSTEQGNVIVFGNAKFATDTFVQRYPDNLVLLQNIVDFVSLDSDLITIRSKVVSDRPLEELSDARRRNLKYFNVFGVTAAVLAFGLVRYYSRRKRSDSI